MNIINECQLIFVSSYPNFLAQGCDTSITISNTNLPRPAVYAGGPGSDTLLNHLDTK